MRLKYLKGMIAPQNRYREYAGFNDVEDEWIIERTSNTYAAQVLRRKAWQIAARRKYLIEKLSERLTQ